MLEALEMSSLGYRISVSGGEDGNPRFSPFREVAYRVKDLGRGA